MVILSKLPNSVKEQYKKISNILADCENTLDSILDICEVIKEKLIDIRNMLKIVEQKLRELPNGVKFNNIYLYTMNKKAFLGEVRNEITKIDLLLSKVFEYIDKIEYEVSYCITKCTDKFFEMDFALNRIFKKILNTKPSYSEILSVIKELEEKNNCRHGKNGEENC